MPIVETRPIHCSLLDFTSLTILSGLTQFFVMQHPKLHTSFSLRPNIFLGNLFSNTFNLSSSLEVRHHVKHVYKFAGEIIGLCALIFEFRKYTQSQHVMHRITTSILQNSVGQSFGDYKKGKRDTFFCHHSGRKC
jgi:hypothetical protein